jgi:hypothetical protein
MERLKAELLARLKGSFYEAEEKRIVISTADWKQLTLDQRAALYNFNLISEDRSKGVHNTRYIIAILNRSYLKLTNQNYDQNFPGAVLVDNFRNSVPATDWQIYQ